MIVNVEQVKKARVAVGISWTTMNPDNPLGKDMLYLSDLLLKVIDDLELGGESILEVDREEVKDEVGKT